VARQLYKDGLDAAQPEFPYKILDDDTYNGVEACDVALVASGTATLETAILKRPMIILYKVSLLTWLMAKACVRIPCIGLVNVVAGRKVVPELIQFDATPAKICAVFSALWDDPVRFESYTFVAPMGESLMYLLTFTGSTISFGVAAVLGVILGSFIYVILTGNFRQPCGGSRRKYQIVEMESLTAMDCYFAVRHIDGINGSVQSHIDP